MFNFFKEKETIKNSKEMIHFYNQLLKMKKKRKSFDVHKVMVKVYPGFIFPEQ